MVEVLCSRAQTLDCKRALDKVVKANRRTQLLERDREIRVLHLTGQGCFQALAEPAGGIDIPFVPRNEQRRKEGQALDVIPMRMRYEQMTANRWFVVGHQPLAKLVGAGPTIKDDQGTVGCARLHARCVATVSECCWARFGE